MAKARSGCFAHVFGDIFRSRPSTGQSVNELVELIGPASSLSGQGRNSFPFLGITLRGQEQREKLVQIIGRERATKPIGRYGGTCRCYPTCRVS